MIIESITRIDDVNELSEIVTNSNFSKPAVIINNKLDIPHGKTFGELGKQFFGFELDNECQGFPCVVSNYYILANNHVSRNTATRIYIPTEQGSILLSVSPKNEDRTITAAFDYPYLQWDKFSGQKVILTCVDISAIGRNLIKNGYEFERFNDEKIRDIIENMDFFG